MDPYRPLAITGFTLCGAVTGDIRFRISHVWVGSTDMEFAFLLEIHHSCLIHRRSGAEEQSLLPDFPLHIWWHWTFLFDRGSRRRGTYCRCRCAESLSQVRSYSRKVTSKYMRSKQFNNLDSFLLQIGCIFINTQSYSNLPFKNGV